MFLLGFCVNGRHHQVAGGILLRIHPVLALYDLGAHFMIRYHAYVHAYACAYVYDTQTEMEMETEMGKEMETDSLRETQTVIVWQLIQAYF